MEPGVHHKPSRLTLTTSPVSTVPSALGLQRRRRSMENREECRLCRDEDHRAASITQAVAEKTGDRAL